jgi:two-component system alkaline phosphatase synthesis response regulator PhoP
VAKFKILFIDDELNYPNIIKCYMETKGDYEVTLASSGKEGIEKAREIMPDMIFLDVQMPDESGLEVLKQLRSMDDFKETTIFMMTGVQTADARDRSKDLNVADYIVKPIEAEELYHKISMIKANKALGK